jgi:peptidoglycan/xylan/chitin deacetylase (PgdA/CDA1 family)
MKLQIAQLAADGHDIESHTVNHLHADSYVAEHGLDAYLADEVAPSFDILRAAGYTPSSFAFPFGAADERTYRAVLELPGVERVRLSLGSCPY